MSGKLDLANMMQQAAERHGDRVFVHIEKPLQYQMIEGDTVTFSDGVRVVDTLANAMAEKLGVGKGDRIALVLTNLPEFAFFCAAAAKLGAVTVPFNYMLKAGELSYAIEDCRAKVLVTERELFDLNIKDKNKLPGIEHWIQVGRKEKVGEGFINIDDLTEGSRDKREAASMGPDDTAGIFYTSGTTGKPKGAMLSARSLIIPIRRAVRMLRIGPKDVCIAVLPMAHIFGFVTQLMGGIVSGASGYLMRFFDPIKTLQNMEKYRGTLFIGVPAMYNFMLACGMKDYDLSSMRLWISGSDAMPVDQIKQIESISGRFIEGYGMVETASLISVNLPFIRKAGSIGIPLPGIRVRIMDEDGNRKSRGEVGEIAVKGPSVMQGYWNNDEANRHIFASGGWMRTGDIGRRDRLGYIYFMDREKDVIKCGGYSIFSREVEEKILEHPKVLECALVGAPHPEKKEAPVAFIQLNAGESATPEELMEWCKEHIAAYKAPRLILIVDDLPLNMTMKVLKRELRDRLVREGYFEKESVPTGEGA